MLKIAIVDDNKKDREYISNITYKISDDWGEEFHVKLFESGEAICTDLEQNTYDVILLDIQMEGMDGAEAAKRIDTLAPNIYVIFLTSHRDMAGLLYDFNVIGFLDKPATKDKLEGIFIRLVNRMKNGAYFDYSFNGIGQTIRLEEILYICKINRVTNIRTLNEFIPISENLDKVWKKLESFDDFAIINRSVIANFKYMKFIKSTEVKIEAEGNLDEHINVGRNLKNELKERHMKYMRKLVQRKK